MAHRALRLLSRPLLSTRKSLHVKLPFSQVLLASRSLIQNRVNNQKAKGDFMVDLEKYRSENNMVEFYEIYAEEYDKAMNPTGYIGIQEHVANLLKEYVSDEKALVVDVGCGTGTSGVYLKKAGYTNIEGTDPSENSLKEAGDKDSYTRLFKGIVTDTEQLPCEENTYDGVLCVGCVSKGHIDMRQAVNEFSRITKPGGYAAFSLHSLNMDANDYMPQLGEAMSSKQVELISLKREDYWAGMKCLVCLVQVL